MSVSSVRQAEDGKRPGRIAAGMSQRGGEVGMAGQAQRAECEVAQAGHHPGGLPLRPVEASSPKVISRAVPLNATTQ